MKATSIEQIREHLAKGGRPDTYIGCRFGTRVCFAEEIKSHGTQKIQLSVRCDCGRESSSSLFNLMRGEGCSSCSRVKHGCAKADWRPPIYYTWASMFDRCTNQNHEAYPRYGGRGISVCERWNSFESFKEDMGDRPPGTSLDRIDTDGDYCKENCRWATMKEQQRNKKTLRFVTIGQDTRCVAEWAELSGIPYHVILSRLNAEWPTASLLLPVGSRVKKRGKKHV